MFSLARKDKPRERFYLLPGQSGRAFRRKQKVFLKYSLIVGIIASVAVAIVMIILERLTHVQ